MMTINGVAVALATMVALAASLSLGAFWGAVQEELRPRKERSIVRFDGYRALSIAGTWWLAAAIMLLLDPRVYFAMADGSAAASTLDRMFAGGMLAVAGGIVGMVAFVFFRTQEQHGKHVWQVHREERWKTS